MLSGFRDVEEKDEVISFNDNSFSTRSAENSLLIPPDWDSYFAQRQNQFISKIHELRQDRADKNTSHYSRSIDGTFSRKKAIENDYIHFFAPGDDIFDCIVDNAMRSCRGQARHALRHAAARRRQFPSGDTGLLAHERFGNKGQ